MIFVMLILGWVAEVYKPSNFLGFQISFILSCQMKIPPINSCVIKKRFVVYSSNNLCIFFFNVHELFSQTFNGPPKLFFSGSATEQVAK